MSSENDGSWRKIHNNKYCRRETSLLESLLKFTFSFISRTKSSSNLIKLMKFWKWFEWWDFWTCKLRGNIFSSWHGMKNSVLKSPFDHFLHLSFFTCLHFDFILLIYFQELIWDYLEGVLIKIYPYKCFYLKICSAARNLSSVTKTWFIFFLLLSSK